MLKSKPQSAFNHFRNPLIWVISVCCGVLSLKTANLSAQESPNYSFDLNYFKGNIALHNTDIQHLITGHPEGLVVAWNRKTYGEEAWQAEYNYPDYGLSLSYQNLKEEALGHNMGLYAHYSFYFLNRNLMLRVGQGLALTTNPYHKTDNFRNIAFGTRVLSGTYLMLQYKKEHLVGPWGLQLGFTLMHYSNANVKAPNTSINTIALNMGINYVLDEAQPEYLPKGGKNVFKEPVKINAVFRTGLNESDVIDSEQYVFYILSAYADKRISRKSALQLGADFFISNFLKEYIRFRQIAYPEDGLSGDEDFKRAGIFLGHELFVNKLSIVTQFGYYVYYPFDFEGRTYIRAGLKRYFQKKYFAAITLKSHGARAEALEFGFGIRF